MRLKIGIIGAGFIAGRSHIPAIKKLGNRAEIIALADTRADALQHMAKYYNIEKTYTDPQLMLKENEFDLVHICTANRTHKEFAIAALRSGAHVLCEKPLALNLQDVKEMFAEADKAGRMLIACQNNRFGPMQKARELYKNGTLGDVYFAELECTRSRGVPPWGRFHVEAENGHGPLCDVGVHFIDAALFAFGNPQLKSASASTYRMIADKEDATRDCRGAMEGAQPYLPRLDFNYHDFSVEDFAAGLLHFENGLQMQLRFSWASNLPSRDYYRIAGSKAGLTFTKYLNLDNPLSLHTFEGGVLHSEEVVLPIKGTMTGLGHDMLIAHLADVLQNGTECLIKREEMLNVVAAMDAFYRSAAYGREVTRSELSAQ